MTVIGIALDNILYYFLFSTCKIVRSFYFLHFKFLKLVVIYLFFFCVFFGGLECDGRFFAYVAHFIFLRDVWIRTQRSAVARRLATNLASQLLN
jgi:hypothetical protein